MAIYRVCVEQYSVDPFELRRELEQFLPETIEAESLEQADERIEAMRSAWAAPIDQRATGLSGLCVSVIEEPAP
jgi:hypothetical protein